MGYKNKNNFDKPEEYIGKVYNSYTIIGVEPPTADGDKQVLCRCVCGVKKVKRLSEVVNGWVKSCGCQQIRNRTHGLSRTDEYLIWIWMKSRCYHEKDTSYAKYGGRGIKICDRWLEPETGFLNFLQDMGKRPSKEHSIDRINVNGDYTPENCRWADLDTQNNNKRNSIHYLFKGKLKTIPQIARITGINENTLYHRVHNKKMTIEEATNTEILKGKNKYRLTKQQVEEIFNSENLYEDIAKKYNIPVHYVGRIKNRFVYRNITKDLIDF